MFNESTFFRERQKRPKTVVPDPKSAQKPRFCARKARKQGFQTLKAHKNLDFVLENPKNGGSEDQKRTKMPILCSKRPKQGSRSQKAHKKPDFVLEKPENEGSEGQKRTKMPILCSGMIAASPAAPTGAQHYPPRALRGASGSSAPGNRLPQPTTQPAAVHTTVSKQPRNLLPRPTCRSYRRAYRRGATAEALPQKATAEELPPCMSPGHTTVRWVPRPAGG